MPKNAPGWHTSQLTDGWKECSGPVEAPSGGVLEIQAFGLTGCELSFLFDSDVSETQLFMKDIARIARPVQPGRHVVGVRWRGLVDEPANVQTRFHNLPRTIAQLEHDAPDLAAVMKKNNPARFVLCDALIVSQPHRMSCQVYGLFTVDKKLVGVAGAPVIKQDFLVHDRNVEPAEITYYTGFNAPGPHRSIEEFCERFGEPNYGCEKLNGKWRCRDHHYSLADWDRLPTELAFRSAIADALEKAKAG
jgi:hypothetical protein